MPLTPKSQLLFLILLLSPSPSHHQILQDPALITRLIAGSAFLTVHDNGTKTSTLYTVHLPPNLSSVSADVVRFRAGSLRRYGTTIKEFHIPPGLVARRHTKRLILVRHNLGRLSSVYDAFLNSSDLHLLSPVVGILVYDAELFTNLDIVISEKSIVVDFTWIVNVSKGQRPVCAMFALDGTLTLSTEAAERVCHVRRQGMFALVVGPTNGRAVCGWKVVVAGALAGVFGAAFLGLVVVAVLKAKRRRSEVAEMERRAHEEEVLQVSMVGHMRAPTALVSRTRPTLEED